MENVVMDYLEADRLYIYLHSHDENSLRDKLTVRQHIDRFWKVRFEMQEGCSRSMSRYEDIVSGFLALDSACGILAKLEGQMALVEEIRRIYDITSRSSPRKKRLREYRLYGTLHLRPWVAGAGPYVPLFRPEGTVREIVLSNIQIFPSSTFPILVPLDTDQGISKVIYKRGDDLTKDLLVLETIKYMSRLMDIDLVTYKVIPLSRNEGLVEVVDGTDFTKIRNAEELLEHIERGGGVDRGLCSERERAFMDSLCGYSVACYVMGVGDRNPGNMMVTADGRFLHVDFSHVFGSDPKPISPRIAIPKAVCDYLESDELVYQDFLGRSGEAFLRIRRRCVKIFVLWCVLAQNSIFRVDLDTIVGFVQDRLWLGLSEEKALELFRKEAKSAVGSLRTSAVHLMNKVGVFLRR